MTEQSSSNNNESLFLLKSEQVDGSNNQTSNGETPTNSNETTQPKRRRSSKRNSLLKYYSNPIPEHLPFVPLILPLQDDILFEISRTFNAFHNKNFKYPNTVEEDKAIIATCVINLESNIEQPVGVETESLRKIYEIMTKRFLSQIKQNIAKHCHLKPIQASKHPYAAVPDHEKYDIQSEPYQKYRAALKNHTVYRNKGPVDVSVAIPGL